MYETSSTFRSGIRPKRNGNIGFCFKLHIHGGITMKNHKSEYSVIQTVLFMIRQAAKEAPTVLVWLVADAILALILQLLELYVTPVLLRDMERQIAWNELVKTILLFSGGMLLLTGLKEYMNDATYQGKIEIRMSFCKAITAKIGTTSYCNFGKKDFQEKKERANQATNGNNRATEIIWTQLNQLLFCLLGFFAYLLVMKRMNLLILAVTVLAAIVSYLAVQRSVVWLQNNRAENDHARQCFWYLTNETWSPVAAKDVRILHMKEWLLDTLRQNYDTFMHFERSVGKRDFMADAVNVFAALIRNGVAYVYLIGQVLAGNMDAPQFILYFSAVSGFTNWVQGIMENVAQIRQSGVGISDVMELLFYAEPYRFEDGEALPENKAGQYELKLENVSFRYPGASEDTLHNLNLTIRNGEKLAVVGRNGAGKSTLVKLLCGFFDPTEGRVLLNGEDIRKYNRKEYYRLFSAVFQDFSILAGTIAENVAQSVEEMDASRVKEAVKDAGLKENIERLPEQYETRLGRSVYLDAYELSGGETQRLMLARALYRNAPVIVLDEPTAALDPIAESDLYERYHELTKGSTSIYVSHRLASTKFCDRIILIGAGGIAEMGTHEELMDAGKEYAHLYEIQSRYYTEGGMEDAAFHA